MMRIQKLTIGSLVLTAVLLGACSEPPQQEIEAAQAALSEAEAAGAEEFAPRQLQAARDAMDAVQAELDAQAEKFALFRSYKQAAVLAEQAADRAEEAAEAADAGRQEVIDEAQSAVRSAREVLTAARSLVIDLEACRRKPKGFSEDIATMKATLDGLATELGNAEASLAAEEYGEAKSKAETVQAQGQPLVDDLASAKSEMGC